MLKRSRGALDGLYEWFRLQLSKYAGSHRDSGPDGASDDQSIPDIASKQKEFVKAQMRAVLDALDVGSDLDESLVTVRKGFCKKHRYLRPVYAEPSDLNRYMSEPDQQVPFGFEFGKDKQAPFGSKLVPTFVDENFICIHEVDLENGEDVGKAKNFYERIDGFWRKISSQPDEGKEFSIRVNDLNRRAKEDGKSLYCIFAGGFGDSRRATDSWLQSLFATYVVRETGWSTSKEQRVKACVPVAELFSGLELIAQLDAKLFELQGLRIMADLLPVFVDEEKPRSDKISEALMQLSKQMEHHLVGRPEWGGEGAKLFYLSASFEKSRQNEKHWIPRLEVYPQAYRNDFPLVSMMVSHAAVPSASKFLLKAYLDAHWRRFAAVKPGAELDPFFVKLLSAEALNVPALEDWTRRVIWEDESDGSPNSDCLHMVEHDEEIAGYAAERGTNDPWKVVNQSIDSEGTGSRSLLAFVIEGEKGKAADIGTEAGQWAFPRGILAFESTAIDAFSDEDIKALQEVVRAFGSLVRLITHHNACLEYRSELAMAFESELRNILPDTDQTEIRRKFVFSVRKIDGLQFHNLLEKLVDDTEERMEERRRLRALLDLSESDVATLVEFKNHITPVPDGTVGDERRANQIVAERVTWAIEKVRELYDQDVPVGELTKPVVEFLFACTENFQWAAYFSSVAQALGDRAAGAVPTFQLMTPGYSASRMFMASVQNELRQVVKLSEYGKLNKERENYRQFVRYMLVNSARMPNNGFAFDGMGWTGDVDKAFKGKMYGALVSDLISAGEKDEKHPIKTFVTLLYECIVGEDKDTPNLRSQIQHSIASIFTHGTALWQEEKPKNIRDNVEGYIRDVNRIPKIKSEARGALDFPVSLFNSIYSGHFEEKSIEETLFYPLNSLPDTGTIYQISHRDLNSRNLTWSSTLTAFLLIDFEHVGDGYLGFDQGRLWLNAICELYGEGVIGLAGKPQIKKICAATDELIEETKLILEHLANQPENNRRALSDYIDSRSSEVDTSGSGSYDATPQVKPTYFAAFFAVLLRNFPQKPGISTLIVYSFYCSILKEFQYSCRGVDPAKLGRLLTHLGPMANVKAEAIHEAFIALEGFLPRSEKSLYFRHLTAARLLRIALEAARTLRDRENGE